MPRRKPEKDFNSMAKKVLTFFVVDEEKLEAKCKLCIGDSKPVKFSKSSKTNLLTHWENHHKDVKINPDVLHDAGINTIDAAFGTFRNQPEITDAVIDYIVEGNLPITHTEPGTPFRKFMTRVERRWKPICSRTVRKGVIKKGQKFKFDFQSYRLKYGKPSTTCDIWSSRARQGFLAITMHVQTPKEFQTKLLDIAHIPSPHTAENIKRKYEEVLADYGLDISDVFKTVCDGASNMKKAFNVNLWEPDIDEESAEPADLDEFQDVDIDFEEMFREQYRSPCNIHLLQLLVKDFIEALPPRYKQVLGKCKTACRKQHQSVKITESTSFVLPAACETRWNGQYKLLCAVHEKFEEVKEKIGGFITSDKPPLNSLVNLFQTPFIMTQLMEPEKIATLHLVIPLLCNLESAISANTEMPTEYIEHCKKCLAERFSFVTTDELLLSATVLSMHTIRWHDAACTNTSIVFPSKDIVLNIVKRYIGRLISQLPVDELKEKPTSVAPCAKPVASSTSVFSADKFFVYGPSSQRNVLTNWETQFDKHMMQASEMSLDLDPLAYWKSLPTSSLSIIAIQILGVTASSAPVERVFSAAGRVCTPLRSSMAPDLLSAFVRAKYNGVSS